MADYDKFCCGVVVAAVVVVVVIFTGQVVAESSSLGGGAGWRPHGTLSVIDGRRFYTLKLLAFGDNTGRERTFLKRTLASDHRDTGEGGILHRGLSTGYDTQNPKEQAGCQRQIIYSGSWNLRYTSVLWSLDQPQVGWSFSVTLNK